PFIPHEAGQREARRQWTADVRRLPTLRSGIKTFKLEINTGFIKRLPRKWPKFLPKLSVNQICEDSVLASLLYFPTYHAVTVKNKGLMAEACEWDEEELPSDDNDMVEVKVLMALAEENDAVSKEGAKNGEWVKISMRKSLSSSSSLKSSKLLVSI
ncbi:hypothetical protein Tco_1077560, partial [Tanacetum coccineum]